MGFLFDEIFSNPLFLSYLFVSIYTFLCSIKLLFYLIDIVLGLLPNWLFFLLISFRLVISLFYLVRRMLSAAIVSSLFSPFLCYCTTLWTIVLCLLLELWWFLRYSCFFMLWGALRHKLLLCVLLKHVCKFGYWKYWRVPVIPVQFLNLRRFLLNVSQNCVWIHAESHVSAAIFFQQLHL